MLEAVLMAQEAQRGGVPGAASLGGQLWMDGGPRNACLPANGMPAAPSMSASPLQDATSFFSESTNLIIK